MERGAGGHLQRIWVDKVSGSGAFALGWGGFRDLKAQSQELDSLKSLLTGTIGSRGCVSCGRQEFFMAKCAK